MRSLNLPNLKLFSFAVIFMVGVFLALPGNSLALSSSEFRAGHIIDELGLKGTTVGNAEISQEHANFIVNRGQATANDVKQLIALIKTRVREATGIQLEEEVQYL